MASQLNEFSSLLDFMQGVQAEDLAKDAVGLPMGNLSGFFSRGGLLGLLNNQDAAGPQNIQEQLRQQINGTPQEEQFIPGQIIEENVGEFNTAEEESKRFGTPPPQLLPGIQDFLIKQSQTGTRDNRSALSDSKKKQLSRLIEIQRIDPKMAALTMKIIQSGQDQEIKAAQREIETALRESNALLRLPDEMLNSGIADMVKERARRGLASPRLIKAAQESDLETKRELLKLRRDLGTKSSDLFKLRQEEIKAQSSERLERLKSELKREEEKVKPKPGFTLSQEQRRFGPEGKEIARGAPKIPTKTSLIQNLEAIGIDPLSAEGKDIIIKSLTKPGVKIDLSEGLDFKLPLGFMLLDKNDPAKGVTPIPGGPKDNLTSENAAKTQMLQTARRASAGVRDLIFDKDGTLNRTNLFNAQFNTPTTDGRKLRNKMEFGIQAITRLETGAAMPENEVENTRTRFMPTIGDTVEIANLKLQMFDDFINGTLKLIDPSGRFNAERFDTELKNRISTKPGASITRQSPAQTQGGFTIKRVR